MRRATVEQAAELAVFQLGVALVSYRHIFPPEAPPPAQDELAAQWASWLGDPRRRALVAGDAPIAGIVLGGPDADEPSRGHLSRLYVAVDLWGQGIGRRLYDACLDGLRHDGYEEATLWVLERNTRARSWYERLGWTATGATKPVYEPAGIVDVGYRIAL